MLYEIGGGWTWYDCKVIQRDYLILSEMCQYRNVKVRQLQFNNTHFVSNIFFFLSSFFSKLTGVSLTYIFTILSPLPLE